MNLACLVRHLNLHLRKIYLSFLWETLTGTFANIIFMLFSSLDEIKNRGIVCQIFISREQPYGWVHWASTCWKSDGRWNFPICNYVYSSACYIVANNVPVYVTHLAIIITKSIPQWHANSASTLAWLPLKLFPLCEYLLRPLLALILNLVLNKPENSTS